MSGVRQAIAYALDRRDIISKAYYNHAFACDVPVPPDSWLYDSASKIYDTDVAKARDLLEDAGWADYDEDGVLDKREGDSISRMRLTLLVNDTPDNQVRKDVAALIKARLALVGIEVGDQRRLLDGAEQRLSKGVGGGGVRHGFGGRQSRPEL